MGGSEIYEYYFELIQNENVTSKVEFSINNTISSSINGTGTCVVKIIVRDSFGNNYTTYQSLLD
jgi:hypothetical protein